jgi:hypothetical protein
MLSRFEISSTVWRTYCINPEMDNLVRRLKILESDHQVFGDLNFVPIEDEGEFLAFVSPAVR